MEPKPVLICVRLAIESRCRDGAISVRYRGTRARVMPSPVSNDTHHDQYRDGHWTCREWATNDRKRDSPVPSLRGSKGSLHSSLPLDHYYYCAGISRDVHQWSMRMSRVSVIRPWILACEHCRVLQTSKVNLSAPCT